MNAPALLDPLFASGPLLVLTDFDGTLAPIVDDPDAAAPLPGVVPVLQSLPTLGVRVAVISGRPVAFLLARLAPIDAEVVGQYGLESARADRHRVDPRAEPFRAAIGQAADELERAFPALRIERKAGLAVTVHWREHGAIAPADLSAIEAVARDCGLTIHATRMARELRPPIAVDKATAVDRIVRESGARAAMFLGDDLGDLVAFDALTQLRESGVIDAKLNVGVVSPEMPPELNERADVLVDGPGGVLVLLEAVAARAAT